MIVGLRDFMESAGLDFSDTGARQRVVSRLVSRKVPLFSVGKNIRGRVRGVWFNSDTLLVAESMRQVIQTQRSVVAEVEAVDKAQQAQTGRKVKGNGNPA